MTIKPGDGIGCRVGRGPEKSDPYSVTLADIRRAGERRAATTFSQLERGSSVSAIVGADTDARDRGALESVQIGRVPRIRRSALDDVAERLAAGLVTSWPGIGRGRRTAGRASIPAMTAGGTAR